jgi:uncharacterized membrane protein
LQTLTATTGVNNGKWFSTATSANTFAVGATIRESVLASFLGHIDEVRVYNRAITADEVKQLYRMGALPRGIK